MFGYVQAAVDALTEEEKKRYRAIYCGLCHTLDKKHGMAARFSLTYDMTFLILFLSSLYEPEEEHGVCRCVAHPWKSDEYSINELTEYAADMTVALVYHKCLDDWKDEHKLARRGYAAVLKKAYRSVALQWPKQVAAIEACIKETSEIESNADSGPDAAANCFGTMLGTLFCFREDHWKAELYRFGFGLGQFIYTMDAVMDCEEDQKKGNYNPVLILQRTPEEMLEPLMQQIGRAAEAFERLPMIQDAHLLRNVIYSGVWLSYNRMLYEKKEAQGNG